MGWKGNGVKQELRRWTSLDGRELETGTKLEKGFMKWKGTGE